MTKKPKQVSKELAARVLAEAFGSHAQATQSVLSTGVPRPTAGSAAEELARFLTGREPSATDTDDDRRFRAGDEMQRAIAASVRAELAKRGIK